MHNTRPILIVGLPRSGTTWVGEVMSSARDTHYIFEPDNEKLSPLAWFCKRDLHRFPYLTSKDESDLYHQLWNTVMGGLGWSWFANNALGLLFRKRAAAMEAYVGDKSGFVYVDGNMHTVGKKRTEAYRVEDHPVMATLIRQLLIDVNSHHQNHRMIIKSVHTSLSMNWLSSHFPLKVLFVLRNPYSLYLSYKRMKMPDGFRNLLFQKTLQRDKLDYFPEPEQMFMVEKDDPIAFQIMLMYKIIEKQVFSNPEWILISHDRLCMAPHEGYNRIFNDLGLVWSAGTDMKIDALNKTGKGFAPKRISSQQPSQWKKEMVASERLAIQRWIDRFDLHHFFQQYIDLE